MENLSHVPFYLFIYGMHFAKPYREGGVYVSEERGSGRCSTEYNLWATLDLSIC